MNTISQVPPGFRFHPTDEELVDYYLRKKVSPRRIGLDVIKDVDLYKIEPWDLQDICRIGTEEQNEWYLFSHKDKKYPTGTRTNRATAAGFWKATGRDKAIYSKHELIGMRKTLVFYKGRAPNGQKSDWIMHEYRLETTDENTTPQEEGWVVCRVFKKRETRSTTWMRKVSEHDSPCSWYDDRVSFIMHQTDDLDDSSPNHQSSHHQSTLVYQNHYLINLPYHQPCKKELDLAPNPVLPREQSLQLPLLESPKLLLLQSSAVANNSTNTASSYNNPIMAPPYGIIHHLHHVNHALTSLLPPSSLLQEDHQQVQHSGGGGLQEMYGGSSNIITEEQFSVVDQDTSTTDWRVLDKFVAPQLSQENNNESNKDNSYSSSTVSNFFQGGSDNISNSQFKILDKHEIMVPENDVSTSNSTCPIDLGK